ncbi:AMP-binding protein [Actinokineospora globicatena]|uniref:Amino acid adenylation protein n=1 Tax=Actinokineospora globicatena TaxID=103729 RepID=A0A9W6QH49_9PSEU|nr:AMP-binding protein [Actinokineospora globicatena]GLW90338.1 amino acid adenylation protein [Actinokineospora globicatena]
MNDRLLYDWFGDSVEPHAGLVALEVDGHTLTYRELDELVRAVAARICGATGGPPARVGLAVSRSRTAYAAYLATLRLGATPVPLNAGFPAARLRSIADSARLDLVIRDAGGAEVDPGVPALDLPDAALDALPATPASALPASRAGLDDLAYILFTSGSTGSPKGVPLTHRNISPFVAHVREHYPAGPGCRHSQVAELTFDPSVHDMFVAWSTGAALVVPTKREILSPVDFVNRRGLTHWFSVPSIISAAERLGDLAPGAMPGLRWSLFSGEPLKWQQVEQWRRAAPNSALDNIYGPTELTGCYEHRVVGSPDEATGNGTVPIGRPYPDMEIAVIGDDGRPAAVGELVMRGVQRFPGYLDPAQNTGRFVAIDDGVARVYDGTGPVRVDHWYRTGDLVTHNGDLAVHLGRVDHQVKVRGHRVEVGEVEQALRTRDGVRDAVVLGGAVGDGDTELRAAFTGVRLDTAPVLAELGELLPEHMVPRSLTWFDELPLNPNGKIDRLILSEVLFDA